MGLSIVVKKDEGNKQIVFKNIPQDCLKTVEAILDTLENFDYLIWEIWEDDEYFLVDFLKDKMKNFS